MRSAIRATRGLLALCLLVPAMLLVPSVSARESARPWMDASLPPDERARLLLRRMTLEEKVDMLHGEFGPYVFFNEPIERLGIPPLAMDDGPAGIRITDTEVNGGRATALPAPIALAATWDRAIAGRFGDVLGNESSKTGHNVVLAPTVDIARVPLAGRVFEAFGEDPYLQAQTARAVTRGIQRHPVVATVKHYNVYTQETDRFTVSANVDDRPLQEIYTPPFEAAVQQGRAGAVMCAYNRVNGTFACENRQLLTGILKRQLGFRGWVMSDYLATPSTVPAARAGLDQEMPNDTFFGEALLAAVRSGEVSRALINDKVLRILRQMFRLGLFDHPIRVEPLPEARHGRFAREVSERSMVLLKNSDATLPLSTSRLQSIAVIGADADNASAAGGGSSHVDPTYTVGALQGIRRRAGAGVRVSYQPGTDPVSAVALLPGPPPVPSSVFTPAGAPPRVDGLRATYWANTEFSGPPALVRTDPQAAANLGLVFAHPALNASSLPEVPAELIGAPVSIRWTGTLTVPRTGTYRLALTSLGSSRLYLDGRLRIDHSGPHELSTRSLDLRLVAGEPRTIKVEHVADHPSVGGFGLVGATVKLGWQHPPNAVVPAVRRAAALARRSDAAVVLVRDYESEQADRPSLTLPNEQDALIRAVADANPRTVVVLNTGAPVTMPWLRRVPAVVEAWYGGQEQGNALAAVVFGDVNPGGKLPLTFPRSEEQTPVSDRAQYPGVGNVARFREGVFVGYRGYDRFGIEPLFPFGHGLSYTSFRYGRLRVERTATGARVAFSLTNVGARGGSETAQVYVGELPTTVPTPPKQLAAYGRVTLAPGESRRVSVEIARRSLSFWSERAGRWVAPQGRVSVYVGSSSRDVRLVGVIPAS